jgi:hypothetical protein
MVLFVVLVAASLSWRFHGSWDPNGAPLSVDGISLGMNRAHLQAAGWRLEGRSLYERDGYVAFNREQYESLDAHFRSDGRIDALVGAAPLYQGPRRLIRYGATKTNVFEVFRRRPEIDNRFDIGFPEAGLAVGFNCRYNKYTLEGLHLVHWSMIAEPEDGRCRDIFLGGVPYSRLSKERSRVIGVCPIRELPAARRPAESPRQPAANGGEDGPG